MAGQRSGEGVDVFGGPVIDPTKNVLDLVRAESLRQDGLREAEAKFQDAMREAESKRIDELARLRSHYEGIIEGIRSRSLETTSKLLATQLREVKQELAERMSKMEQFRWETGGKTGTQAQVITWAIAAAAVAFAVAIGLWKH